jgi:DNA-binding transcriptional regulator YiaG
MTDNHYVREARRQLKLSQEAFAERLFIARETVCRYERGTPVPLRKVLAIQELLQRELRHG